MSRVERLFGKPVVIEIEGEKLDIYPMKGKDMDLILDMESDNKEIKLHAMQNILIRTIKRAIPEATDAEILEIPFNNIKIIFDAALKANAIKDVDTDGLSLIKNKINQVRGQVQTVQTINGL